MDLLLKLRALGLPLPAVPEFRDIATTVTVILVAVTVGWLTGRAAALPLTRLLQRATGRPGGATLGDRIRRLLRSGIAGLLMVVGSAAIPAGGYAALLLAATTGLTLAVFAYRVAQAVGLRSGAAMTAGAVVLVTGAASMLGGLHSLTVSLDAFAFKVGTHRLSLLGVINFGLVAVVLFVLARFLNRVLGHTIERMSGFDSSQRALLQKLAGIVVVVAAILFGIDLLGIDLTALTVFSGAFGLAVGFGLQKTFGNLIAGVILLMDRSIKPGDVIVVGNTFGSVNKIGVRAVSVVTRDGKEHLIPNEKLMTDPVENWSYSSPNIRVHIPVGVAYNCDLALAQRLMIEAATASERVLAEPRPTVWLMAFGESSVDHEILAWIRDPEAGVGNVRSEILNRLWISFREHGIEIPFAQRDINIRSLPSQP
ncbi:mechanosensitive ion channel family protein [Polymorphobacter sp. PAMC 29334]|uniref:mechanosensitive ion channel family protein n=1 Tax=Polymorphobacter sp. PAMC 29334 TaxID=2862331 RepID=UPI001D02779B|nr:mechanosensitive ion channel domain-containing protein [Polymorphobacter sp. PAMC 29334]